MGGAGAGTRADQVVVEEPLRINIEQGDLREVLGSTMRTPGHDLELAAGLAVGEGIVRSPDQLISVRPCRDGNGPVQGEVTVTVSADAVIDSSHLGRVATPSSACGVCGRDHIDDIVAAAPRIERDVQIELDVLAALPEQMRSRQSVFDRTGGLHAAAIATADGTILAVREDVGRHNSVDKVIGYAIMNGITADVLIVSGRAGFEIVQKAAMAGIPVVASVSAATSLSVDVAIACNLTLAGFVRDGRMTVYSAPERIISSASADVANG
jgi:FdhD protein